MRNRIWQTVVALLVSQAAASAMAQESVHWQTDVETAKRIAAGTNRLVVLHFWSPSCQPCMALEQTVFSKPGFGPALESKFVPVKVNTAADKSLAVQYGVRTIPTDVVITPSGAVVGATPCAQSPEHYLGVLNGIVASSANAVGPGAPPQVAAAPAQQAPPPTASTSTPGDDRYAEYYRGRGAEQQSPAGAAVNPYAAVNQSPMATQPPVNYSAPSVPPHVAQQAPPQAPAWQAPTAPSASVSQPPNWTTAGQPAPGMPGRSAGMAPQQPPVAHTAQGLPPGSPPLGLEGYCPVQLFEQRRWVVGDVRWGAIHEGRTYLFAGPEEQQKFLANPYRYAPVNACNDPVVALENGQAVIGRREHGVFYDGRIYLFSSEESLSRFSQAPAHYAVPILQAMRPQ